MLARHLGVEVLVWVGVMILDPAVERTRVGCDVALWQGATRRRLNACNEEQRGQSAAAQINRVRSALTQTVKLVVCEKVNIHAGWPAELSGQLPDLG